jgi:hypothetical protein
MASAFVGKVGKKSDHSFNKFSVFDLEYERGLWG